MPWFPSKVSLLCRMGWHSKKQRPYLSTMWRPTTCCLNVATCARDRRSWFTWRPVSGSSSPFPLQDFRLLRAYLLQDVSAQMSLGYWCLSPANLLAAVVVPNVSVMAFAHLWLGFPLLFSQLPFLALLSSLNHCVEWHGHSIEVFTPCKIIKPVHWWMKFFKYWRVSVMRFPGYTQYFPVAFYLRRIYLFLSILRGTKLGIYMFAGLSVSSPNRTNYYPLMQSSFIDLTAGPEVPKRITNQFLRKAL